MTVAPCGYGTVVNPGGADGATLTLDATLEVVAESEDAAGGAGAADGFDVLDDVELEFSVALTPVVLSGIDSVAMFGGEVVALAGVLDAANAAGSKLPM